MGKARGREKMATKQAEAERDRISKIEYAREYKEIEGPKANAIIQAIQRAGANLTNDQILKRRFHQEWAESIHGLSKPPCWDILIDFRRPVEQRWLDDKADRITKPCWCRPSYCRSVLTREEDAIYAKYMACTAVQDEKSGKKVEKVKEMVRAE